MQTSDPVVLSLVREIKLAQQESTDALASIPFTSLYDVGRTQGKVDGFKQVLIILDQLLRDQDE